MACRGAAGEGVISCMIKDIIIHISAGPHARLPDTDSQDLNPNTGNSPGRRYPAPRPLLSRLGHRPARPRVLHRQHQEPSHPQGLRHRRPRLRRLDGHRRHHPSPLRRSHSMSPPISSSCRAAWRLLRSNSSWPRSACSSTGLWWARSSPPTRPAPCAGRSIRSRRARRPR